MGQLVTEPAQAGPERRPPARGLFWLVVGMQASVAVGTLVSGRAWGGITYMLAVAQTLVCIILVAWLLDRHPQAVLLVALVPALSGALSAGLYVVGERLGNPTACTDELLASVQDIAPVAGGDHDFDGESPEGCAATYRTDSRPEEVVAHYRAELVEDRWMLRPSAPVGTVTAEKARAQVRVTAQVEGAVTRVRVVVGENRRYVRWAPPGT